MSDKSAEKGLISFVFSLARLLLVHFGLRLMWMACYVGRLLIRLELSLLRITSGTLRAVRGNEEALFAVYLAYLLFISLRLALRRVARFAGPAPAIFRARRGPALRRIARLIGRLFAGVRLLFIRIAYKTVMAVFRLCGGEA